MDEMTPPPRPTRADHKEQTHRQLVEAANRVMMKLGYQGATADKIAAEAGFTKGAVYWHFKNKEALFLELLADGLRQNIADLNSIMDQAREDPASLRGAVQRYVSQQTNRNVPMLILELELESRRNPSLAAIFQQVIS
ncbi:MAG TPA: TetR/AcrR family transcriptional regulator, partial [Sphingomicrobium sp.]|nr:TetR/AcrR family transcriptional regulator [Sphingomicrobium sp.]